jgi:hypothetical protein
MKERCSTAIARCRAIESPPDADFPGLRRGHYCAGLINQEFSDRRCEEVLIA